MFVISLLSFVAKISAIWCGYSLDFVKSASVDTHNDIYYGLCI